MRTVSPVCSRSDQSVSRFGKPNKATSVGLWNSVTRVTPVAVGVSTTMPCAWSLLSLLRWYTAAAVYHRNNESKLQAHGIVVLTPTATGVTRVTEFHNPTLVALFGFPNLLTD